MNLWTIIFQNYNGCGGPNFWATPPIFCENAQLLKMYKWCFYDFLISLLVSDLEIFAGAVISSSWVIPGLELAQAKLIWGPSLFSMILGKMADATHTTQWAQSGGQGDIGQIFIQNADFHEGMAQNKTATPPLSFWLHITTDQSFHMRYCTILYHNWPNLYIFVPKLSQMILYDSNQYLSSLVYNLEKEKFDYLNLDSNLCNLMQNKNKNLIRKNKTLWH